MLPQVIFSVEQDVHWRIVAVARRRRVTALAVLGDEASAEVVPGGGRRVVADDRLCATHQDQQDGGPHVSIPEMGSTPLT